MIRIILFCIILTGCTIPKEIYKLVYTRDNSLLYHTNYNQNGYNLPDTFICNKLYFEDYKLLHIIPKFDSKKGMIYECFENIDRLIPFYEIVGDFRNWLIFQPSANPYYEVPISKEDSLEILNATKQNGFFFLGHLKDSFPYSSFLILVIKADDLITTLKTVLQINHIKGKITSLRVIGEHIRDEDSLMKSWTEKNGENYIFKRLYDDSFMRTLPKPLLREMKKNNEKLDIEVVHTSYTIDNKGKVHVINSATAD